MPSSRAFWTAGCGWAYRSFDGASTALDPTAPADHKRRMLAFVIRRVLQSVLVLLVVGLVAFSMFRFVGDPIDNMLGQERTQADIERLRDAAWARSALRRAVLEVPRRRGAGQFRRQLPAGAPGGRDHRRTRARDAGTGGGVGRFWRSSLGIGLGVFTAIRRDGGRVERHHDGVADRGVAADLPDRDPADLRLFGGTGPAAQFRARRDGADRRRGAPGS